MDYEKKYIELVKNYFDQFSKKNIAALEEMFSDNITLRDWNFKGNNKNEVLEINKKIFENANKIDVKPLSLWIIIDKDFKGATIFADLKIEDENGNFSLVLDIITFKSHKNTSITAYKGN